MSQRTVIGNKEQPFRILIQSAYRKQIFSYSIFYERNYSWKMLIFRGTDTAGRLI